MKLKNSGTDKDCPKAFQAVRASRERQGNRTPNETKTGRWKTTRSNPINLPRAQTNRTPNRRKNAEPVN